MSSGKSPKDLSRGRLEKSLVCMLAITLILLCVIGFNCWTSRAHNETVKKHENPCNFSFAQPEPSKLLLNEIAYIGDNGTFVKFDGYFRFNSRGDASDFMYSPLVVKSVQNEPNENFTLKTECLDIIFVREKNSNSNDTNVVEDVVLAWPERDNQMLRQYRGYCHIAPDERISYKSWLCTKERVFTCDVYDDESDTRDESSSRLRGSMSVVVRAIRFDTDTRHIRAGDLRRDFRVVNRCE